jgi:hypothetical protein
MTTVFAVCFMAGVALSVLSFVSGLHPPRALHLPKAVRAINVAAITAFLTWFGGGGLLLERWTSIAPLIYGGAALLGIGGGALINHVIHALARRESTAQPLSMIGVIGKTVVPIRAGDGTGEIVFTPAGARRVAGARSDSGRAIHKGTEVIVTRYEKGIAYVAPWDELEET